MNSLLEEYKSAISTCTLSATRHKKKPIKETLLALANSVQRDEKTDTYGAGDVIEDFEKKISLLLGKEAAVFMPSGTMAQPIALKIWADRQRTPYVALHATSHLALHEQNGYQILYGLKGLTLGQDHRVPALQDLKASASDPLAAILLELPMREIGGQIPTWEELLAQSQWAKSNNIKLHMDGARLWQCPAAYEKSLAEISALFDSVYVSFYKDLDGIAGAILAGDADFIEKAKIWQRRAGGNIVALYPYVIAAREGLKQHLPLMEKRLNHTKWLADKLNKFDHFQTMPLKPQVNMFRLRVNANPNDFLPKATQWAKDNGVALISAPYKVGEDYLMCELSMGDAFEEQSKEQWQHWIDSFNSTVFS